MLKQNFLDKMGQQLFIATIQANLNLVLSQITKEFSEAFNETWVFKIVLCLDGEMCKSDIARSLKIHKSQLSPGIGRRPAPCKALHLLKTKRFIEINETPHKTKIKLTPRGKRLKIIITSQFSFLDSVFP